MSILPSHSLIFNAKTTIVICYSFTSFLPSSSISTTTSKKVEYTQTLPLPCGVTETVFKRPSARYRKLSQFSIHSSFNDSRGFTVPKKSDNSDDKLISFVDEWGEKSGPELRPMTKLSDSDPPIDVDEWGSSSSSSNSSEIEDEWGEKSGPELRPEKTVSDSDPPIDEDEWAGAKLDKPDPTRIAPLPPLVSKLVGNKTDRVKNEGVSGNKITSFDDRSGARENASSTIVDELGEKSEPELQSMMSLLDSDSAMEEDEWGETELVGKIIAGVEEVERVVELKRCIMETVYGTDFGFKASSEVRAEALELVAQLEAANPTPNPVELPELLDGNWILVFTAFSELLPLLAVGTIPLLKVEKISQTISTSSLTIENSTTLSSPIATSSFSATAAFEVRSPSRIQVEFKEGTFKPPEIKSKIDLPENMDIFGQNISLSNVQQSLGPLENAVAGIARTISGLPPLKVPIPGERTKSWLITTYLDNDLRISRGDGGLFVLVKEQSSLLNQ